MALRKKRSKTTINLAATRALNSFKFTSSLFIKESVQTPSPLKASVRITIFIIEKRLLFIKFASITWQHVAG